MLLQKNENGAVGAIEIIAVVKIIAISWSKALGCRDGLLFPVVSVASVFVAVVQVYVDISYAYGLIAALAGSFISNKKLTFFLKK